MAERPWLVTHPGARGDGGDRPAVFSVREDRFVAPGTFVTAPLLDDEAEVHPAPAGDVLDCVAGPDAAVRHALAVQQLGHLRQGALCQLLPDAAHDRRLLGHDDELAGVDEKARGVAPAAVAKRIMAAVPTVLEEPALHPRHPLRVEVALQLGGQAELPEEVAPGGPVEPGTRQVRDEERHLPAFQLMMEVEHQPVLVVHSKAPDEALEELAKVEDSTSPVRIIISVGMLKEGWDVRNVYVIASMRSSVSEILTEQTLGRGMRLPFGAYTGIEILDTLEVVAHERYEELLKKAGVLNEAFVDYRTRAALRINAKGQQVVVTETVMASTEPIMAAGGGEPPIVADTEARPVVTTVEQRAAQVDDAVLKMKQPIVRRPDAPAIAIPLLRMSAVESGFTLADITDTDRFRRLGASLAANPDGELARTLVSARVVVGPDGIKRTELVTSGAADKVQSIPTLFAQEDLRNQLVEIVIGSPAVPARKDQRAAVVPLMDSFFTGLGDAAVELLSANLGRAGARLVKLVAEEQRQYMGAPSYQEVIELRDFAPARATDKAVSGDRFGAFSKAVAYEGWKRSLFPVEWFDSRPERTVANMVDEDDNVASWVRLHIGELPILWNSAGQEYNPDFIVIDLDGTHWVVEVKMDKEMSSEDVKGKREAARRWANYVTADEQVGVTWRYLLVSESDVDTAKGSWSALKKLGGE